jgi:hypothetical protein
MRRIAMQIQRDRHESELHHQQSGNSVAPEPEIKDSVEEIDVHIQAPKRTAGMA